jgi:organic hydroperoxide reductase OsmC/OhrA
MVGTFGGALEARQIAASAGNLVAEAIGEVETEGKVLVIKRIHVRLLLRAPAAQRETAERVQGVFADACPIYRSLRPAIAITSELVFEGT